MKNVIRVHCVVVIFQLTYFHLTHGIRHIPVGRFRVAGSTQKIDNITIGFLVHHTALSWVVLPMSNRTGVLLLCYLSDLAFPVSDCLVMKVNQAFHLKHKWMNTTSLLEKNYGRRKHNNYAKPQRVCLGTKSPMHSVHCSLVCFHDYYSGFLKHNSYNDRLRDLNKDRSGF